MLFSSASFFKLSSWTADTEAEVLCVDNYLEGDLIDVGKVEVMWREYFLTHYGPGATGQMGLKGSVTVGGKSRNRRR